MAGLICSLASQSAPGSPEEYRAWLAQAYPAQGPGAAVIVVREGEVLYRDAIGLADLELGVPLEADHVFRIGSLTKQFTAAAILLLEEAGKLSVADDINDYLPDYPTHGHTITIEHLLTHTAGIYNYTDIPGYLESPEIRVDVTTGELLELFANRPMDFAPGVAHKYSNSGYAILGAIIEQVSGQPYAELVQDAIFDKVGMKDSYYGGPRIIPNRIDGYRSVEGEYLHAGYLSMTHPHGAGALLSTVDDLARWNDALFSGELLSKSSLAKMTRDFRLKSGDYAGYGYGFALGERFGQRMIYHTGGIHGFSTSGIYLPQAKVYVVVLSNDENSHMTRFLSHRIAFDAAGAEMPRLEPIDIDAARLRDYIGVYEIDEGDTRSVVVDAGRLYTQRTGGNRSEIVAYDVDAFFYPGSFTHLRFVRDRRGGVVAMEMYHDGASEAERSERISAVVETEH